MFNFDDLSHPLLVFIGIIVAQLFMYGRKIKERVTIALSDLISDLMQFAVMFIVCMGFLQFARTIVGWDLDDPWQLVTVVILFNMSFDTWFNRLRETFNSRVGTAFDVLIGKKTVAEDPPPPVTVETLRRNYGEPIVDPNRQIDEAVAKLDSAPPSADT